MKKRLMLAFSLLLTLLLLCSCTFVPASKLEALFGPSEGSVITSGDLTAPASDETGDTVTISREEYEKYQKFAEVYSRMTKVIMSVSAC